MRSLLTRESHRGWKCEGASQMNFSIGVTQSNNKVQTESNLSECGWYRGLARPIMIRCESLWGVL